MKTYIIDCNCKHEFQDNTYGKQKRVATPSTKSTENTREVSCTVCGKTKVVKK